MQTEHDHNSASPVIQVSCDPLVLGSGVVCGAWTQIWYMKFRRFGLDVDHYSTSNRHSISGQYVRHGSIRGGREVGSGLQYLIGFIIVFFLARDLLSQLRISW